MAGESALLKRLQTAASLLDDEALASLANKGLLRRAKNDLRSHPPTLIEPTEITVQFQVEDCTVELAESIAQSRCTCPAAGTCRHILSAILFLKEMPVAVAQAEVPAPTAAGDEVLAVTDEELRKWAGTALVAGRRWQSPMASMPHSKTATFWSFDSRPGTFIAGGFRVHASPA